MILLASGGQAVAAERVFTVTGFDRIRVEGPYAVDLRTGTGPSAKASGDQRALDRLRVEVQGTTLIIKLDRSSWGGWPDARTGGVSLVVTTPNLSGAMLNGAGDVSINRMAGARIDLAIAGSGDVAIGRIETDRLGLTITGSGGAVLAGKAAQARIVVQGAGDVDAAALAAADADVLVAGSGDVALAATRSAKVRADGPGNVTISGKPACAISGSGTGQIICGGNGKGLTSAR